MLHLCSVPALIETAMVPTIKNALKNGGNLDLPGSGIKTLNLLRTTFYFFKVLRVNVDYVTSAFPF